MRTNLFIAAIINFILAAFLIFRMGLFSTIGAAFLIVTAVMYLNYAKLSIDELAKKIPTLELLGLV